MHGDCPGRAHGRGTPDYATKGGRSLELEPGAATQPGLREWLAALGQSETRAAAFDTRIKGPRSTHGPGVAVDKQGLSRHGTTLVDRPRVSWLTRRTAFWQEK